MIPTFTTTDRVGKVRGVKALIYGRAGMGKTTLCGTAPRPLIISAEAGLMPLRHLQLPVVEVTEYKQLWDVYEWVSRSADARHIDTLCLDSVSEIAEVLLEAAKKRRGDPRQAYGDLVTDTLSLLRAFRDLPDKHVVFIAKQATTVQEVTGVVSYGPMMPGRQVGPALPYVFDLVANANVGRAQDGSTYHYLRTRPDHQYEAKDRSGVLDEIEYPDLSNIFAKIKGA